MTMKKRRNRQAANSAQAAVDKLFPDEEPQVVAEIPVLVEHKIPENMSDAEKALLGQASARLLDVEQKMLALVRAAYLRWKPAQSVFDTDETQALVFSDDEYAAFCSLVERIGDVILDREIAKFLGLPPDMVDTVITEKLRQKLLLSPNAVRGMPFVIKRGVQSRQERE